MKHHHHNHPSHIANLILFGRATNHKMVQNLVWATDYNLVAIPLAAGVLFYQGIMINPAEGAANVQLLRLEFKI